MFKLIALLEVQAVAVRAFFKPRRAGKQGFSRRRIAGPALAAGRISAVVRNLPFKGAAAFPQQKLPGYPGIEMIPRQGRVEFRGPR